MARYDFAGVGARNLLPNISITPSSGASRHLLRWEKSLPLKRSDSTDGHGTLERQGLPCVLP
jgi:hypothetical protein